MGGDAVGDDDAVGMEVGDDVGDTLFAVVGDVDDKVT